MDAIRSSKVKNQKDLPAWTLLRNASPKNMPNFHLIFCRVNSAAVEIEMKILPEPKATVINSRFLQVIFNEFRMF